MKEGGGVGIFFAVITLDLRHFAPALVVVEL